MVVYNAVNSFLGPELLFLSRQDRQDWLLTAFTIGYGGTFNSELNVKNA